MTPDLTMARLRAEEALGVREVRCLGTVHAPLAAAFARAAGIEEEQYVDPTREDFAVHPLYLPSMLRGHQGGEDADYRSDGMFADEVPGTRGLTVRLMAGGQTLDFVRDPVVGESVDAVRTLDAVTVKGRADAPWLLLEVAKEYVSSGVGILAYVRESFIVR